MFSLKFISSLIFLSSIPFVYIDFSLFIIASAPLFVTNGLSIPVKDIKYLTEGIALPDVNTNLIPFSSNFFRASIVSFLKIELLSRLVPSKSIANSFIILSPYNLRINLLNHILHIRDFLPYKFFFHEQLFGDEVLTIFLLANFFLNLFLYSKHLC